jgi:GDPmannose 4,6-dehydratase
MDAFFEMGSLDHCHDLILATGVGASIEDYANHAFRVVGLNPNNHLTTSKEPFSLGIDISVGNPSRAKEILGWQAKITWREVVERMVQYDLQQT